MLKLARVLVLLCCLTSVASAQQFAFGASLGGIGRFDGGLFGTGLPGTIILAARVEWLDVLAKGLALRFDIGTEALSAGLLLRFDLSEQVNFTLSSGLVVLPQNALGLTGRIGFEYRFAPFAVSLEYGLISPFSGALRSNLLLSFLWFFSPPTR